MDYSCQYCYYPTKYNLRHYNAAKHNSGYDRKRDKKKSLNVSVIRIEKHYFTEIRLKYLNLKYTMIKKLKIQSMTQKVRTVLGDKPAIITFILAFVFCFKYSWQINFSKCVGGKNITILLSRYPIIQMTHWFVQKHSSSFTQNNCKFQKPMKIFCILWKL